MFVCTRKLTGIVCITVSVCPDRKWGRSCLKLLGSVFNLFVRIKFWELLCEAHNFRCALPKAYLGCSEVFNCTLAESILLVKCYALLARGSVHAKLEARI